MRDLLSTIRKFNNIFNNFYSQESKAQRAREKLLTGKCDKDLVGSFYTLKFSNQDGVSLDCFFTSKDKNEWLYIYYYPHIIVSLNGIWCVTAQSSSIPVPAENMLITFMQLKQDDSFALVGCVDDLKLYYSNIHNLLIGLAPDSIIDLYICMDCDYINSCSLVDSTIALDVVISGNKHIEVILDRNNYSLCNG